MYTKKEPTSYCSACRMMLVMSDENSIAALGGSLARSALEVIEQDGKDVIPQSSFKESADVVHAVLKSKVDAQNLLEKSNAIQPIACLGIRLSVQTKPDQMVAAETARSCGGLIQDILDEYESVQHIAVTLDLSMHLALLQANTLPKIRTKTSWHVLFPLLSKKNDSPSSIAAEYLYDWDNPFGGTDPLACPTIEYQVIDSSIGHGDPDVQAAAFTALQGQGLDLASSAGLAASVATIISKNQVTSHSLEEVLTVVEHYKSKLDVVNDNGALRRAYIEFGYK